MRTFFGFGKAAKTNDAKADEAAPKIKAEGDALAENMREVNDFWTLLLSIEQCGGALQEALTKLQTAPTPLLDCLSQSYSKESAGGELLQSLGAQLNACIYHTTLGTPHLEEMMARVKKVKPRIGNAKEAFQKREAAWTAKVRCDKDAAALKGRPGGGKTTFTTEERRARLKAKNDADEEFKSISDEVWRQCNEILYNRWSNTAAALTDLGHCYAAIFEAPPKLANDLLKSVAQLTMSVKMSDEPPPDELSDDEDNDTNEDLEYLPMPDDSRGVSDGTATAASVPPPATSATAAPAPRGSLRGAAPAPPGQSKAVGNQPVSPKTLEVPAPQPPGAAPPTASIASAASRTSGASRASGHVPPPAASRKSGTTSTSTAVSGKNSPQTFKAGDHVLVWSSSSHAWLDGIVKEAFTQETTHDIYSVPAGVIKVESAAGIKFIQPEQVSKLLRKNIIRTDTMGTPSRPLEVGQL